MILSFEEAQSYFTYNSDTGALLYKKKTSNKITIGDPVGSDNGAGYIKLSFKKRNYYAHRVIWLLMTGKWPKDQIDHVDHDRSNNKWDNLKAATNKTNGKNQSLKINNMSGISGVHFNKRSKYWQGSIKVDGKHHYLMGGKDLFEICCARKSAELKYGFHPNHCNSKASQHIEIHHG